jgi:8-oxo-dGTP pyrophosphatase MutT (NUDIX family)
LATTASGGPGGSFARTAIAELAEETGIEVSERDLIPSTGIGRLGHEAIARKAACAENPSVARTKGVVVRAASLEDAEPICTIYNAAVIGWDNIASVRLVERCGFSLVGLHRRHGQLDGNWRDVAVVERLLTIP